MITRRRRNQRSNSRVGSAVIEVALVIPILLFLVIGTVEICELIFLKQSLKISAYEGARIAVVPGANTYDVEFQVKEFVAARNVSNPTVTINPPNFQDLEMGEFVTVEVTVDMTDRNYFSNLFRKPTKTESVSMMKEQ